MNDFVDVSFLISQEGGFGINTDIFDTGIINLALLLGLLFIVGKDFLNESLGDRQKEIIRGVEDAETRLNEANSRLNEAKKQLAQAQVIIEQIKTETQTIKKNMLAADCQQASTTLSKKFNAAASILKFREQQVLTEIKQQVSTLALKRVITKLQSKLTPSEHNKLIEKGISRLGGQL
jgi:F-type H+-transporting ATPase subunit b